MRVLQQKTYVIKDLSLTSRMASSACSLVPPAAGSLRPCTALRACHPASGEIRFDDEVMTSVGDKGKNKTFVPPQERNIAMVFQEYALYPNMSVRENMSFALKTKKNSESGNRQAWIIWRRCCPLSRCWSAVRGTLRRPAPARRASALVRDPQVFRWTNRWATLTPAARAGAL